MNERALNKPTSQASVVMLLAAVGGGAVLGARPGSTRARPVAMLAGLALVGIAAHRPLADALRRVGTKRRSADLRFSFTIDRPVEQVFGFCADFENFPRFIESLREVRDNGDGRSHWCASTPSGGTIEWDAVTTKFVTNSVIGWRNVPGAPVETTGLLRFSPEAGRTCVRVAINYAVPNGSFADAIAALAAPRRAGRIEQDIRSLEECLKRVEHAEPVATAPELTVSLART